MENNVESGIDMNSSSDLPDDFSSPERITKTKLTPRTLVYDDIDGDEMPPMIRRRTLGAFAKNNNNNDEADKLSMDDDDDTSKFRYQTKQNKTKKAIYLIEHNQTYCQICCFLIVRKSNDTTIAASKFNAIENAFGIAAIS